MNASRSAWRIGTITLASLALSAAVPGVGAAQSEIDTLLAVTEETRLELHDLRGDITIRTWDRDFVRLVADAAARGAIRIQVGGRVLAIHGESWNQRRKIKEALDYRLTVPVAMDLSIHGLDSDVTIEETRGRVEVGTVRGDIKVRGGRTLVQLQSVQGSVDLVGARASVEAQSVNQPVQVTDVTGELKVTSVNGGVVLSEVDSRSVEATTINGAVRYRGTLHADGRYSLSTHNGPIDITVPAGTNASVHVSTFNGRIEADFPIAISELQRGKEMRFTLGSGGARIELASFNGTVWLRRPEQPRP
ncbi:MAG TPA: DUF4097 family beta strand repeat-containing protein [Gemmatimonadota bacterium]|nr:DUF4097 family beta strand repeat-containing protein [Gemmatimonadota bacterium]